MKRRIYTEQQILFIKELFYMNMDWDGIAKRFNKKFDTDKTAVALINAYQRYGDLYELEDEVKYVENLRDTRRTKRTSSKLQTQNARILDYLASQDQILHAVRQAVSGVKLKNSRVAAPKSAGDKRNMTMELLLSDLHYGKLTDNFDSDVARDRASNLTDVFLGEYKTQSKIFNIDKIIIAMLGDMIESYTMHGLESAASCEMGNSEQIVLCITSLFEDVIAPVAKLGVPIFVPCVTGNHDRTEKEKTFNKTGKSNVTWVIYHTLKMLCTSCGWDHVDFEIAENNYLLVDIYSNKCLYEHGDHVRSTNKKVLETHMANRSKQLNCMIDFMRLGHWHEVTMYEQGRIIINGSLPGQDSYSDIKGYNSQAFQVINYYIETEERPNCFYKSFPVYLG